MAGWWRFIKLLWNPHSRKGLLEQLNRLEDSGIKLWDRSAHKRWVQENKHEIHVALCPHRDRHKSGQGKDQGECKKCHK
jgi:hypothetical protein